MMRPASSLLQSGVIVVPQFWQAGMALVEAVPDDTLAVVLLLSVVSLNEEVAFAWARANFAVLETRLLNAGQPLQPC